MRIARLLVAPLIALAAIIIVVLPTSPASAHGSVINPASRNYGCWERWGSRFQDPTMATQDPMCWQAWQANPNAMWNWNGLYRENLAGNHQANIPDGQLCSGGHAEGGRYNSMDTVGNWQAKSVSTSFSLRLQDQASHGADYIRVYVTRSGYDPTTQPLRWSDLTLVSQIGYTPASQWQPASQGVQIDIPVSVPGRSGRAMFYTIWQASHMDQSYYFCSDVNFGGSNPTNPPTSNPTTPPTTTPPTTTPPSGSASCTAAYTQVGAWTGGFQADVRVTAGSRAITSWTVTLTYANGAQVSQVWNGTATTSGSTATVRNAGYNGAVAAGASTTFGLLGSGAAATPTVTCAAT
ncbi:chitin-binding protein [Asanoa hainanensis]|uniref:Chitin-binding protein n=1 Tax=Asanoa hainanensis TaxID=560556 RepID=A0A239IIS2_9ACTN|nr:lytic polysaccharide monooxygenase [Asanoa hainanensis]SNS93138.1 chitin-binding protein [Asanoa hainanensis]